MIVYSHLNKINGKRYVGWTKLSLMGRWHVHVLRASNGSSNVFHKAIRKYSEDVWEHTVLDVVSTLEGALIAEKCWISHFKCNAFSGYGYNMTDGGQGSLGRKHSKEAKQKISQARIDSGVAKGHKNPMYGKTGLASPISGEKNGFWGKRHAKDFLLKMSEDRKGILSHNSFYSDTSPVTQRIIELNNQGKFSREICSILELEGFKPMRARHGKWNHSGICRLLGKLRDKYPHLVNEAPKQIVGRVK